MNKIIQSSEISPVKTCVAEYGIDDINSYLDCCYNVCSSFVPGGQQAIVNSDCGMRCLSGYYDLLKLKGKSTCQNLLPVPVVINRPIYFNECAAVEDTVQGTVNCCIRKCREGGYPYKEECEKWCRLAGNAVVINNEGGSCKGDSKGDFKPLSNLNFNPPTEENYMIVLFIFILIFFVVGGIWFIKRR